MSKLLLEVNGLTKSYGQRELFRIDGLTVYDGERIGLIGENGAGKSTLLAILAGAARPDAGVARLLGPAALIRQQGDAEEAGDRGVQALLGAPERRDGLSGGEMTRRRIAAALAARPRLLLADEPTTDLDEAGRGLLYDQLRGFQGALILVSHDRDLLRRLCGRIWYLEDGTITDFPGGYDDFQAERSRRRERAQFEYDQYRQEQARLKASAQRMAERASAVKKAPSRMGNSEARLHKREATDAVLQLSHAKRTIQNRMEHMEVRERPRALPDIRMQLGVKSPIGAKTALEARCARMTAGGQTLLENTGFTLPTGSRTALLGGNGCGKTTLLRALNGQLSDGAVFEGGIRFNPAARVGWFDQHQECTLDSDKTILENVTAASSLPESTARTVLARLGFQRDDAFKPVSLLSGGERTKTALARLLLTDCNLLLMDEPTNHLDIFTLEALEELLAGYGGTLLFVSHDADFVARVATRTVRFSGRSLVTAEGSPDEQNAARPQSDDAWRLAVSTLEMRMAGLADRMSRPRKGDKPEALNAEYLSVAEELRRLKRENPNVKK